MTVEIPHFALPFRFVGGHAAVNEQDSVDDVEACVLAVASYPVGSRIEKPEFGVPDQTFRQGGVDVTALEAAVNRWEPRASAAVIADNSGLADRIGRATVQIKEAS